MTTTRGLEINNGVVTKWIPLTTTNPPASQAQCSSAIYFQPGNPYSLIAFDPYYGLDIDTKVTCLQTEMTQWWEQYADGSHTVVNLGPFSCPGGYTTATASTINSASTFVGCCPNVKSAGDINQCFSPITAGQTIIAKSTVGGLTWYDTTHVVPAASASYSVGGAHVNGFVFNQAAVATPAAASTTTLATMSSSATTTQPVPSGGTQTQIPTSTNISAAPHTPNAPILTNGAKVGIGIGVTLGVFGIICLVAVMFLLKRRGRQPGAIELADSEFLGHSSHGKAEKFTRISFPGVVTEASVREMRGVGNSPGHPAELCANPSRGG
ncbi:hypothetical protein G7Y89_g5302 [Cudoniella acicularis]|uniref:Uncharacterized protein n=1 Tax=Cudoniella acicularis TaxID=354080 RepID=A0A8H4RP40_9HELO|nr:hypothetical protein G7Y89_g5302 [Cudoniella acicularis]